MRGLLWVTVILAVLWGGWWVIGSRGVKAAAEGWLAEHGSYEDLTVAGFPNRFDLTVTGIDLADPASGIGWRAPFAQVFAMTWKPWHLIAALPGGQVFSLPDGEVTLDGTGMMGSLLLVPGGDMALSEAVVQGAALRLSPGLGVLQGAEKAVISIRAETGGEHAYRLGLNMQQVQILTDWATVAGMPGLIDEGFVDATATLSAQIDRHAGQTQPGLRQLDLAAARLNWGELHVFAKGALTRDEAGFAAGQIDIRIENWRLLPPVLVALGLITEGFAPALTRGFEVMAEEGGDPAVLTLPLIAKAGRMSLGPLPLGAAPVWQ